MKRFSKLKVLVLAVCCVGNMFPMFRQAARVGVTATRVARHGGGAVGPRIIKPVATVPARFAHCHDLLGVKPDATKKEITTAYRAKSLKAHPDAGGSNEEFVALGDAKDEALARLNGTYSAPRSSNSGSSYYRYEQPSVEKTVFNTFKNLSEEAQKEQAFESLKSYLEECDRLWASGWNRDKAHPTFNEVQYFLKRALDEDKAKMSRLVIDHAFAVDRAYYIGFVLVGCLEFLPKEEAVKYAKNIIKTYFENTNHLWDVRPMHMCLDMLPKTERVEACEAILEGFLEQRGVTADDPNASLVFILLESLSDEYSQQYVKRMVLQYLEKSADPELSYGWRQNRLAQIMRNLPDSLNGSVSVEVIKDYADQGRFHMIHSDDLHPLLYSATQFAQEELSTVMTQIVDDYIQREQFELLSWYSCFGCLGHTQNPFGFGRSTIIDPENQRLFTRRIIETYLGNGRLSELFTPALADCVKKCLSKEEQELFVPQILDYYAGVWEDIDYKNGNFEYSQLVGLLSNETKKSHYQNLSESKAYRLMHRWNPFK